MGLRPRGEQPTISERAEGSSGTRAETIHRGRKTRILAVEDNATNRKVALLQLRKLGYETGAATNGAEAIEAVKHGRYDLVLMDCQMPVMDGFEATREIRKREQGRRTRIVALTAGALQSDEKLCLDAGMDAFVSKPVELNKLAELLERWHAPAPV